MADVKKSMLDTDVAVGSSRDVHDLEVLGYKPEMKRNRTMFTLLFQSLAIAAIPYGFGSPLITAIYGGGQLPMFVGWVVACILAECVALSLSELASRYPTSAGPYYWAYQLASPSTRTAFSFLTGWVWLIGNWTITLSVNFGMASLIAATVALYHPEFTMTNWQLLLIFYAMCVITFVVVAYGNSVLPVVDTLCAAFTLLAIIATMIAMSVKADVGRHSVKDTLGYYDTTLSGWNGFSFFIGILPGAYTFSAIGMISSMAEECGDATVRLPRALSLCVPIGGLAGLFFIIPMCATLPDLTEIIENSPVSQALPYIYGRVMGSPGGGLALTFLVIIITVFCSISITVAASRCTWAFARDQAIPWSSLWARIDERHGVPIWALALTTLVQMLLGLINLGSSSAFIAFVSVGVMALAASYGIPIALSVYYRRREIAGARWKMPEGLGWAVNFIALAWILFEIVLFTMPTALPVTEVTMNYASVVLVGFLALSGIWYAVHARKVFTGPPESAGLHIDDST
ncbi:amino acid/polyamine transporter I [Dactylonectria estremocensis]|uniref:Amino acid/polyamine transporter I n=1 Tax=Dactylonectria estremocensis TaxID=1079267 RepID=A0A9P9EPZ6_9HYPO|nr:amino acid/polyamine transporter I [Dactylonectria estremocensis]